jgi:hypothetical protein
MQQSSQLNILSENFEFNKAEKTKQLSFNKTKKQKKSNTLSVDFFSQNGQSGLMQSSNRIFCEMCEGAIFYKAFSTRQSLKSSTKVFDPLQSDKLTPEQCGYGIRMF